MRPCTDPFRAQKESLRAVAASLEGSEASMPLTMVVGGSMQRLTKALQLVAWAGLHTDQLRERALFATFPTLERALGGSYTEQLRGATDPAPSPAAARLPSQGPSAGAGPSSPTPAPAGAPEEVIRRHLQSLHAAVQARAQETAAALEAAWSDLSPLRAALDECLTRVEAGLGLEDKRVRMEVTAASRVLPRGAPQVQPLVEAVAVLASTAMGVAQALHGGQAGGLHERKASRRQMQGVTMGAGTGEVGARWLGEGSC